MRVRLPPSAPFLTWSSDLGYIVGLIVTDGHLTNDKRHIQFTTTDLSLAKQFNKCLGINAKILKTPPSGYGKKPAYRINFSNVLLYRWLEKIGITNKKSHLLDQLDIPQEYFFDFLRGHLDGDGSVFSYHDRYMSYKGKTYAYQRLCVVFNSCSEKHLRWIQKRIEQALHRKGSLTSFLRRNRQCPMWKLKYSKNDSLKLLSLIYYKQGLPSLGRKRKIAERFIKNLNYN